MKTDLGHWSYSGENIDIPNMVGFVYCITCKLNNRKYIGKKILMFKRVKGPLKNRKNRRRYRTESDWRTYCGSSKTLNEDIIKYGKENFSFEILSFHPSKLLLAYTEAKTIVDRNAIFSNDYYNEVLNLRIRARKVNLS
jgi:hypothetical protein